jgi:tetratricopeptide (TPR) repeat protein
VHAFQGRSDESIAVLSRALDIAPSFPPALNHLGLVLKARRRLDEAAECFRRAVVAAPEFPEAHINLGNVLLEQGQRDDALASFQEALRIAPSSAQAHNNIGIVLFSSGADEAALESFRRAVAADPRYAEAHANLARALNSLNRDADEAEAAFRRAIAVNPRFIDAYKWLGEMLASARRYDEAAACFRNALALDPASAEVEHKLGLALSRAGVADARAEAAAHFTKAVTLAKVATAAAPGLPDAWETLGNALLRLGRPDEGFNARLRATAIVRAPDSHAFDHLPTFRRTSRGKLDHDIEQIRHLVARGAIDRNAGATLAAAYETVRDRLPAPAQGERLVELSPDDRRLIGATYKRLWHVAAAPEIPGGAVNPALDRAVIEADYFGRGAGVTWIDQLLTPEALAALRRFCLESTIWFTDTYPNGYIGSLADDGFVCPLLLQIGREMPERLPGIFGKHPLLMMWAYKYGQNPQGISIHADYAAINVNLWITPDEANLDPDTGGLIVWDKEAAEDWDFRIRDVDQQALTRFVAETGAQPHRVPYRQNRVVIFNSDLIHRTDDMRFRPGYENRRINVTFLYGER